MSSRACEWAQRSSRAKRAMRSKWMSGASASVLTSRFQEVLNHSASLTPSKSRDQMKSLFWMMINKNFDSANIQQFFWREVNLTFLQLYHPCFLIQTRKLVNSDMFTLDSWYSSSQLSLFSPWLLQSAYLLNQLHHQRDSISLGSGSGDTHIN